VKSCWIVVLACACGSSSRTPVKPGDDHDEGAGILARASTQLMTGDATPDRLADNGRVPRRYQYGGIEYGGGTYGGDPYGGTSYAHWTLPTWNVQPPNRVPRYTVATTGLDGAIEGTVTWTGAVPGKLATACGPIDNPLHVDGNRGLRDAIIYIERVTTGRAVPVFQRPLAVGGEVTKHGCTLQPTAQIAIPTPTSVSIHGDAHRARVRVTPVGAAPKLFELQEAGLVQTEIKAGVTKVDGEDGKLVAAWIVGLDTPYYSISDDTGHYRIDLLAPGAYEVTFWVPPIATAGPDGTIVYGAPTVVHRGVRVDAVKPAQLSVALPAR
jgi:hypothetical protein